MVGVGGREAVAVPRDTMNEGETLLYSIGIYGRRTWGRNEGEQGCAPTQFASVVCTNPRTRSGNVRVGIHTTIEKAREKEIERYIERERERERERYRERERERERQDHRGIPTIRGCRWWGWGC